MLARTYPGEICQVKFNAALPDGLGSAADFVDVLECLWVAQARTMCQTARIATLHHDSTRKK